MSPIIPAIIPYSLVDLEDKLRTIRGVSSRVQIDVKDDTYAPGRSWPYEGIRTDFDTIIREEDGLPYWQEFDYEIDLLVREPEKKLEEWALAGAACCIVHLTVTDDVPTVLALASERRLEIGLALLPGMDIALVAPYVEQIAFVQVMGNVRVGYQGTSLDYPALETIRALRAEYAALAIGIDIGVTDVTLPDIVSAGATRAAVGSAIFQSNNPKRAIRTLEGLFSTVQLP